LLDFINRSCANTITLFNILFGSLSLVSTINGNYRLAVIYILLAVVMDSLDGRVARRLDRCSELGKQLDSLCDLVSFGVAPALLLYSQVLYAFSHSVGLIAVLFYIVCGAYRLARFNVLNISTYFVGIPITLAGTLTALLSWFSAHISGSVVLAVVFVLSLMMVSNLKVPKIK